MNDYDKYQTPDYVCRYMASLIPDKAVSVLEPTPGKGNLVRAISEKGFTVTAPTDYFKLPKQLHFDAVAMNPPFSSKSAFTDNAPPEFINSGMRFGYEILKNCLEISDNVIALMPWFTISDSDVRLRHLHDYGLISVTLLPRKTFQYARIQTCVFQLQRGYIGHCEFKVFDRIPQYL
jgi:phospholipid N-methyltransferase